VATVSTTEGPVEVGTGRDPSEPPGEGDGDGERRDGRRLVRIDGAPARGQAALARVLGLLWLTPEMDRLFVEGAAARRRFLDRLVYGFDPDHARRVGAYEQSMRERNRLLRDGRSGPAADAAWLAALEDRMAREGVAIAAARRAFVARLGQAVMAGESAFPRAALAMEGEVEGWLESGPALAAEDRLRDVLVAARRADAEAGRATRGPHRSDFTARHLAKGRPAGECSTGEQKALLISIVLADARLRALEAGGPPVLLLDEVAAHLDRDRRAALFDEVSALGAQAWVTGTDRRLFEALEGRAQFFDVADSTVRHVKGANGPT
jgi:DNA replication and repair protein RecF